MRKPLIQSGFSGFYDMFGGLKIGFADLEMNNAPALRFESPRAAQHLEGGLGSNARHPAGEFHIL
jgi:hypothetical protein